MTQTPPKVIVMQTWKTHQIPDKYIDYAASVRSVNPDYDYCLLDDDDIEQMIKTKVPQWYSFWKSMQFNIERIDFARYVWMATFEGYDMGIYLDLDIMCLQTFTPLLGARQLVLGLEPKEHFSNPTICNAVLISPPGHPFWMELCTHIADQYNTGWLKRYMSPVFTTGPSCLTKFYNSQWNRDRYNMRIMAPAAFFPMTDQFNNNHTVGGFRSISAEVPDLTLTYCIHIWGHTWIHPLLSAMQPVRVYKWYILATVLLLLALGIWWSRLDR